MASEWNRGLLTLKRLLEAKIKSLPQVEHGMPGDIRDDARVPGLRTAISEINALIEPEES